MAPDSMRVRLHLRLIRVLTVLVDTPSRQDALPLSAVTPQPKVVVDTFPLRILPWQHPPLDATHHHVEDGIDHHSHIQAARTSTTLSRWNQISDNIPLTVG